jgi:hypothetical protein
LKRYDEAYHSTLLNAGILSQANPFIVISQPVEHEGYLMG